MEQDEEITLDCYPVDSLQAIHPYGPYLLGGASFGSTVAIEMAKQLEEKGESVTALIQQVKVLRFI